jgi:hypothetical protein
VATPEWVREDGEWAVRFDAAAEICVYGSKKLGEKGIAGSTIVVRGIGRVFVFSERVEKKGVNA